MSKRLRIIALAASAALVALIIVIYVGVLNTGAGRRAVVDALRPTLEQALGGPVRIGGTAGHWPHYIILRDVAISDRQGVWLQVPELTLRWNPLALIGGRISISELTIPGGSLSRLPESPEPEPEPATLPRLPGLPNLRLDRLAVGPLNVGREAAGRETALRVTGSANMRANMLDVSLKAITAEGQPKDRDRADIEIHWAPAENRLSADTRIDSPPGGLIAQLSGLEQDGIKLSISGTGPAAKWIGAMRAEMGRMGGVYGNLACDCSAKPHLTLDLEANPGPRLSPDLRRLAGDNPKVRATLYSPQASAWTIEISALESMAGKLTQPLHLELTEGRRLLRFDVSGGFRSGPALKDMVPPWLGETVSATARGAFDGEGGIRFAEAVLTSPAARLNVTDARMAGNGALKGDVQLRLLSAEGLPAAVADVTGRQASLEFELAGNRRDLIRARNLSLNTGTDTRARGELAYGIDGRRIGAELDLTLPPPVFAALTGLAEPAGPVTGSLSAEGPLTAFSATLLVRTPELALDARPLPPAETALTLSGGLDDLKGRLTVSRSDKLKAPALLSADLALPELNMLHVTGLAVRMDGAQLDGNAHLEFETGRLTGSAKLNVPDLAALAATASGSLSADIALETREEGGVVLSATADVPDARYDGYEIRKLKASASGPLNKLMVSAEGEYLQIPGIGPVRDLKTAGSIGATEKTDITLSKLTAIVNGTELALVSPAQLILDKGTVNLPAVAFSLGDKGRVNAEALVTPEAITAGLDLTKAAIPGQSFLATGSVSVDTGKSTPGTFKLRLDPGDGQTVFVDLTGTWNGRSLDLKGAVQGYGEHARLGRNEILTVSIPLVLSRAGEGFSISTEGELNARLKYRGQVNPITAVFLGGDERVLTGDLNADIEISGPLSAPRASGAATLGGGRYENVDAGIVLTAIDARLKFRGGLETASGTLSLTAWDSRKPDRGEPPVTGEGTVTLDAEGMKVTADIRMRKAELVNRDELDATLSGKASLSGTFPSLALNGDIRIDRLDLLIPENQPEGVVDVPVVLVNEKGEPLNPEPDDEKKKREGGFELAMDVRIRSNGQAFIRGRGLDSEWKADLSVGGTLENLILNGSLTLKKGNLSFAGRRFDLSTGEVNFTGQSPPDPVLDVVAEYETEEDTRAIVRVSGRSSEPDIKLESNPPLPREQVMALILFGKPVTELTALQALQVTQSVAQLTGTGPFGGGSIMDRARRTLGLDLLDLTFGKEDGEVGLTVGRYVTEGIFVSASQDVTGQGGKVSVEVEVLDDFSIKTDVGQDASGNVTAQWKKDY